MKETLFEILTYFIIYSFLGWIMESIVRSIAEKKLINTGFLKGPICPIYGIGAVILIIFLESLKDMPVVLFIVSMVVFTLWEYFVGVLLEKLFNTKYWDYSDQKYNYKGRICLTNSICWGFLGIVFVKFIHPFTEKCLSYINRETLIYSIITISLIMIVDIITSIVKMKNIRTTLEKVEELNKEIKEKLKELKIYNKGKEDNKNNAVENIQIMIDKLNKKRNRIVLKLYKNVYRMKKAFPAINTKEIAEVLSSKIDIRGKKIKKK